MIKGDRANQPGSVPFSLITESADYAGSVHPCSSGGNSVFDIENRTYLVVVKVFNRGPLTFWIDEYTIAP